MEKPILFNTEMVQAILSGRKTQTRRIIKNIPSNVTKIKQFESDMFMWFYEMQEGGLKPPCIVGDILWVRETWSKNPVPTGWPWDYKASPEYWEMTEHIWKPSIHMPRAAARLFLKVASVRVEKLQDITENGARKEGCLDFHDKTGDGKFEDVLEFDLTAKDAFQNLWESIYKNWNSNPWVWVIEFERIEK